MKPRINMITLGVGDMEKAAAFYERGLGLPRMPFEGGAAFFMLNGSWLSLYPLNALAEDATVAANGTGFRGIALAHVVSSREDVDEVLNQAVKAGGTLIKPAADVFWGGYSGYFADPDGHLWEVAWNPHFWPGPTDCDEA
ncbi:glyoxalase/bleomycin resistance protein/dioxygenase superfamily protein [Geotalea daltonii FRC-32]|uniref:Glyoxalase/bleomycin resistance protein/dioxygenase superfamily protein n=1 Tax=Geotalea daltonii (strain DSM 22248 / JCM 15807 / FRC-32) TaxID=316067 RepID=B9M9E1_GEODF|nr:VOC family protein [Geotalea daltonii]ACM18699.1 glyoxalase/bleomycin resistance protein/dioxygenase superfamily protein [Geotalea daltonii FRC-32]